MSVERILKALAVTDQGLSDQEKSTALSNIGAQGALTAGPNIDIYNDVISTEKPRVTAGTNVSVTSSLDPQTRVITYTVSATDTTYSIFNTTTDGLVPKASGTGDTGKFLKGDGTWESINTTVSATAPLYGSGTQADPLRLLASHGLSVVQPSGGNTYLQVTHPVPAPGSTSAGKVLTCDDALENLSWQTPPRYFYKVTLPAATEITATDISNGYKDIKIGIPNFPTDTYAQSWDWRLDMFDAGVNHGSTTTGLSTHADALKISVWNGDSDWVEMDTTGAGMLFANITDTEMTRKGGYPYFLEAIRKVGGAPDRSTLVSGPSMRVTFKSGNPPVAGDTITFIGYITAIRTA